MPKSVRLNGSSQYGEALHKNSNLCECRAISTVPRAKRGGGTLDNTPKF